jgi:mannose-6-phosphate isomerase-like protein (cupin superfamily)
MSEQRTALGISNWATALVILVLAICAAQAEDAKVVEVQDEPAHHLVFDNSVVRIFDTNVASGSATLFHHHPRDNVAYFLGACELTNQRIGEQKSEPIAKKAGDFVFARATGEGYIHQVTNIGSSPIRMIDVEFLRPPATQDAGAELPVQPAVDNDRFRAYRLSLAPGESSGPMMLNSGVQILISGAQVELVGDGRAPIRLDANASWQWREAGSYTLRNVSQLPADVVELEVK